MNKELMKQLIKYKLNAANTIIEHLPPKILEEIKRLGMLILEELSESFKDLEKQPAKKPKHGNKLDNITIE